MKMARVILFTGQIEVMSRFYGEVLGLKRVTDEKGWKEFAAGGARIALHSGPSSPGRKGPKIVFYAEDVAAQRERLVARGELRQGAGGRDLSPLRRQGSGWQSDSAVESLNLNWICCNYRRGRELAATGSWMSLGVPRRRARCRFRSGHTAAHRAHR
jgi:hypothetical protein